MTYSDLLRNPDRVTDISWRELHEWVQKYPYVQGLRLLTVRKAKLEDNADLQPLLELAATYSPNRRHLYDFLQQPRQVFQPPTEAKTQADNEVEAKIEDENTPVLTETTVDLSENSSSTKEEIVAETNKLSEELVAEVEAEEIIAENEEIEKVESIKSIEAEISPLAQQAIVEIREEEEASSGEAAPETPRNDTEESAEPVIEVVVATTQADSESPQTKSIAVLPPDTTEVAEKTQDEDTFEDELVDELADELPNQQEKMTEPIIAQNNQDDNEILSSIEDETEAVEAVDLEAASEEDEDIELVSAEIEDADEEPIGSFSSWLAFLNGDEKTETEPKNVEQPSELAQKRAVSPIFNLEDEEDESLEDGNAEENVRRLARASVAESSDIISETLAKLLEMQEKYEKAIKMYAQLMQKYPEKSATFAAQIEKIKSKII